MNWRIMTISPLILVNLLKIKEPYGQDNFITKQYLSLGDL